MESPIRPQNKFNTNVKSFSEMQNEEEAPRRSNILRKLASNRTLLVVIAVLQIIMIILILNPAAIIRNFQNQQLINEVASKTTINTAENPVIATVTNAQRVRDENAANEQVYKDAQNGDYVLGYSDKMIIYRQSTGTIIYEGANPSTLITNAQQKLIEDITTKAKELGLVEDESEEIPQISLITDVKSLQTANPEFYSLARNNDIVALFAQSQLIVLYNQETATIVNSGEYTTSITTL